ncbi:MAG: type II toxin-antitoxin system VapC family toxin [Lentisphaeria bacterium]|nr:type II toxin-antitoxin system VapC family toxin [Lentisphaeria bacterium]
MKYLLDTHVFIWMASDPTGLPTKVAAILRDSGNDVLLSMASIWEMQIKVQLGKLELTATLPELVEQQRTRNAVEILPISLDHLWEVGKLPPIHKDPFDRLLIAQSRHEDIFFLTADRIISSYDVRIVW